MRGSFTERMALAQDLADVRRNRGLPVSQHKSWKFHRQHHTGIDRLQWEYESWKKEWQYQAMAAVESALFAAELEEIATWLA
jgi:hypothetical protein